MELAVGQGGKYLPLPVDHVSNAAGRVIEWMQGVKRLAVLPDLCA
jgi:hypothetical protein